MTHLSNHAPCRAHDDTWFVGFLGVQDSAKLLLQLRPQIIWMPLKNTGFQSAGLIDKFTGRRISRPGAAR